LEIYQLLTQQHFVVVARMMIGSLRLVILVWLENHRQVQLASLLLWKVGQPTQISGSIEKLQQMQERVRLIPLLHMTPLIVFVIPQQLDLMREILLVLHVKKRQLNLELGKFEVALDVDG
jgi:hypothetical protein